MLLQDLTEFAGAVAKGRCLQWYLQWWCDLALAL